MASIIKADTLQSTTANVFVLNSSGTEYARFDSSGVFQLANPTTFPAGTAALPSITATGDTNTGIFFPAADTIAFSEGGVESVRIDSSGNVKMTAANTKILNSSGNPILQQTGSVLQVLQAVKTDKQSTTSTSYVDLTSLSVTITPTSSLSKILVRASINNISNSGANVTYVNLLRGSTTITSSTAGGLADTYDAWATGGGGGMSNDDRKINSGSIDYLDSPATTSATTYKMQMLVSGGTGCVNAWQINNDAGSVSSITVMEIAA